MSNRTEVAQPMKWQEFVVRGTRESLNQFMDALEQQLPTGWKRAADLEARVRNAGVRLHDNRLYSYSDPVRGPLLSISLARLGEDRLQGGHNVALTAPQTDDEFEKLAENFLNGSLLPLAAARKMAIDRLKIPDEVQLKLSSAGWMGLQEFAKLAKKTGDRLGVEDRRLWNRFLVGAHKGSEVPSSKQLSDWLKNAGFQQELVVHLIDEFEIAFRLLEEYDEELKSIWNR